MNTECRGLNMAWHICLTTMLCAFIFMVPDYAFAITITHYGSASVAPKNAIAPGFMFCTVTNFLYGNTGKAVATLGICYLGVKANQGKIEWKTVKLVCIGISAVFGAAWLVSTLAPGDASYSHACWVSRSGLDFTWSKGDSDYQFR
jgi:type IV secretory pathway VirB2 component (pilin)